MRFDPLSFLLGFLSSTGISLAIWRYRARLAAVQQAAESQVEGTKRFIGRTAEARYARDMVTYLQRHHIAGTLLNLSDVLLEPRLIRAAAPVYLPGSEDAPTRDVFEVVPIFHDMPQSYAPFNIETMALDDLGAGDRHVALLGIGGMGKSTALVTLALMAFGEVEFETLEDLTQRAILEEEQALPQEERERRAKERERIQARAMERLHDAHERERQKLKQTQVTETLPPLEISTLMPVFVHLSDIDLTPSLYGAKDDILDPAEPLVRAVQRYVSGVTAQVVGSVIYPALEAGKALILIDGYDEMTPAMR